MLEEMGKSALVFLLVDRADTLRDEEIGAVGRSLVGTYVIGQSVGESADAHIGIDRQFIEF